jgi:hypothetical protein
MNLGFVTFVNRDPKYLELANILVESVLRFTNLPIEVNGINFDYKHKSDRVISKKLNVNPENFATICFSKIEAYMTTNFDYAVGMDADCIVLPEIINIFNKQNYLKMGNYILPPIHPQDPKDCEALCNFFGTRQTQPYIHADIFLLGQKSKSFLQEVYDNCYAAYRNKIRIGNVDESVLNVTLWKHKLTEHYLPLYDPYYEIWLDSTESKIPTNIPKDMFKRENYMIVHGCKEPEIAKVILDSITR